MVRKFPSIYPKLFENLKIFHPLIFRIFLHRAEVGLFTCFFILEQLEPYLLDSFSQAKFIFTEKKPNIESFEMRDKNINRSFSKFDCVDTVVEIMSLRLRAEDATLAKTMLDLKDKSTTNELISRVKENENWNKFVTFCEHLNDLLRL